VDAGGLEHADGRLPGVGMAVVGVGIWVKDDFAGGIGLSDARRRARGTNPEGLRVERRQRPVGVDPEGHLERLAGARELRQGVRQRRESAPHFESVDTLAKSRSRSVAPFSLVVLVGDLGLELRHVDLAGAVDGTALAADTEAHYLLDELVGNGPRDPGRRSWPVEARSRGPWSP